MRTIGEMARDGGLGVSALRFYDRAGVLVPAWVDPVSGYRWYGPEQLDEARLLARLRGAGMPLADVRLVLAGWSGTDSSVVRELLEAHLRRLERGLADARAEFSAVRALLEHRENPMTAHPATLRLSVPAAGLAAALDAVRFAAGTDPDLPALGGVLFDAEGEHLHVVATDRYRLAVARTGATGHDGPRRQTVVPSPLVDAMRSLLGDDAAEARLTVDGGRVTLETGDRQTSGRALAHDFPDYRRLVSLPEGRRALVDVPAFRAALSAGPVRAGDGDAGRDVSVLTVSDGAVAVCADGDDEPERVGVDRDFLLEALAAGGADRLVLELGAPTAPVAVRHPGAEHRFSLLMPVRLDG
ncbi:MerR family transcriptional regulator [Streptomyces sp. NPDC101118]|uniref:DNA polymerase III subunit beta family protein n=1 Tax=Streptomyces sp. NPDC101118 TaxID=3366109 RepID=UPI00380776B1